MNSKNLVAILIIIFVLQVIALSFITYNLGFTGRIIAKAAKAKFSIPNFAPVLEHINNIEVYAGDWVIINATATDPNGDFLNYTYSGFMNSSSYKTKLNDVGRHHVYVNVSDGELYDWQDVVVLVKALNCTNTAKLTTKWTIYSPGVLIRLNATGFNTGTVSLIIKKGNHVVKEYNFTANSPDFIYDFNDTLDPGNYSFRMEDPFICKVASVNLSIKDPYHLYGTITNSDDAVVSSTLEVYEDNTLVVSQTENYDFYLDYGVEYDLKVHTNLTLSDFFMRLANAGPHKNIIKLDDRPEKPYANVFSIKLNLSDYSSLIMNISYENDSSELYLCTNYNFDSQSCQSSFTYLGSVVGSRTSMLISLDNDSEAIALLPPEYCGDGVCQSNEDCHNCKEDCGSCPSPSQKAGGGGGGFYITCTENWSCSEWSSCINGFSRRKCVDSNHCGTKYNMPDILKPCNMKSSVYFYVIPEALVVTVQKGESKQYRLNIINSSVDSVLFRPAGLEDIISSDLKIISVINGSATINIKFSGNRTEGVYRGMLDFEAEDYIMSVPVVVEITKPPLKERPSALEMVRVNASLVSKVISGGNNLSYNIVLEKDTARPEHFNVEINITHQKTMKRVYTDSFNITLFKYLSIQDNITLPEDAPYGNYVFDIDINNGAQIHHFSYKFKYKHPLFRTFSAATISYIVFGLLLLLIIFLLPLLSQCNFKKGYFIGWNAGNKKRVYLNPMCLKGNLLVVGSDGNGKTNTAKVFAGMFLCNKLNVVVLGHKNKWKGFKGYHSCKKDLGTEVSFRRINQPPAPRGISIYSIPSRKQSDSMLADYITRISGSLMSLNSSAPILFILDINLKHNPSPVHGSPEVRASFTELEQTVRNVVHSLNKHNITVLLTAKSFVMKELFKNYVLFKQGNQKVSNALNKTSAKRRGSTYKLTSSSGLNTQLQYCGYGRLKIKHRKAIFVRFRKF